jgi:hypothetical protein
MFHIYYEITIYIYKEIFSSGGPLAPEPHRGGNPPCNSPTWRGVYSSWGINKDKNKKTLNQEDNQAPQPTKKSTIQKT